MDDRLLYLVRHGRPVIPGGTKIYLGRKDVPLSEEGRNQAAATGRALAGIPFDALVTSGLVRADETGEIIAACRRRSLARRTVPGLQEISLGEWEGRSFGEIQAEAPDEFDRRGRELATHHPPGGESFEDLQRRVAPAIEEAFAVTGATTLCCVTHAGVLRVLFRHLLELPWRQLFAFTFDYGGVTILRPGGSPRILAVNWRPSL
ncbi:MAG: histidine phosphatase family protein [Synergistales bacterium]|nr:histidine phosphatase family protein [Synergistales bacterium]